MASMADYSNEALGHVVRVLREQAGMTQEVLGRTAGYQTGAGVAISRLESGQLRPGEARFEGLATALGIGAAELAARAATESASAPGPAEEEGAAQQAGGARPIDHVAAPPRSKDLRERARRIQDQIDQRKSTIEGLGETFNTHHDRARDEFFMPFVELAKTIEGAPLPDVHGLDGGDDADPDTVASFRLKSNANGVGQLIAGGATGAAAGAAVGGVAAYGAFVAAASLGTASTGVAISTLSGVAATNATLALLGGGTLAAGGAGVAGGTMVLAGIVAAPAAILFAGGLVLMRRHNRKQQEKLAAQIETTQAQLAASEVGYRALQAILPRATDTLAYIATHAGHALRRWAQQIEDTPRNWDSLGDDQRRRYQEFVDIASAQVTIVTINVQGVLTTEGADRDELIEVASQVLDQSERTVTALV